jgi:hypothetical protein
MMINACGMKTAIDQGVANVVLNKISVTEVRVVFAEYDVEYTVNVMARILLVDEDGQQYRKWVSYMPFEKMFSSAVSHHHYNSYWPVLLGVITGMFAITLICALVLYRKFKKVERQLDYEMSDVRNVAGIQSKNLEGR